MNMRILLLILLITACTKEETCDPVYNDKGHIIGEQCYFGEKQPHKIDCHGYYRGVGCGG